MKPLLSLITMVTVSPVMAVATLVFWNPQRWGGSIDPLSIVGMTVFGLFTVPLWPTYIPALVITPFAMHWIAGSQYFKNLPLELILGISFFVGVIAGIGVISILVPWHLSLDLILNWVVAGAVSGGVTLTIISLVYRYEPRIAGI
jgi:hypothetical protein